MDGEPTPGWWLTRIEFAGAIGAFLLLVFLIVATPGTMGGDGRSWWEQPIVIALFLGMLFGLAWMIRIFLGPRDEPPPWRYRDR